MYTKYSLALTDGQVKKLRSAINKEKAVTLRLTHIQRGNIPLLLTQTQINRLNKAISSHKGVDITLSIAALRAMKKDGGIFPLLALIPGLLAAAAPVIAKTAALGALAGGASYGAQQLIKKASGKGLRLGPSKKK